MQHVARTKPWCTISIPAGNSLQLGALICAGMCMRRAARQDASRRTMLLTAGWVLAYFSGHALAHWIVGRLGGIRFGAYGVHGTTNPAGYPPGMRWVMQHLPFLSARTDPPSRRAAPPAARIAMYVAGPLATLGSSLGIPAYGVAQGVPHAGLLLGIALAWMAGMLVGERAPHSDLSRARRELRTMIHDDTPSGSARSKLRDSQARR